MKRRDLTATIPMHDYRTALQGAVAWMGDRYLLAEPVARLNEERRPYFAEQRRWASGGGGIPMRTVPADLLSAAGPCR